MTPLKEFRLWSMLKSKSQSTLSRSVRQVTAVRCQTACLKFTRIRAHNYLGVFHVCVSKSLAALKVPSNTQIPGMACASLGQPATLQLSGTFFRGGALRGGCGGHKRVRERKAVSTPCLQPRECPCQSSGGDHPHIYLGSHRLYAGGAWHKGCRE